MENIPSRRMTPPDEIENPRCGVCDQQMREIIYPYLGQEIYECDNPKCEECNPKWKQKVSEE